MSKSSKDWRDEIEGNSSVNLNRRGFLAGAATSTALVVIPSTSNAGWPGLVIRAGVSLLRWVGKRLLSRRFTLGATTATVGTTTAARAAQKQVTNNFILSADLGLTASAFHALHIHVAEQIAEIGAQEVLVQNLKYFDSNLEQRVDIEVRNNGNIPKLVYLELSLLDGYRKEIHEVRTIQIRPNETASFPITLDDSNLSLGERRLQARVFHDPQLRHEEPNYVVEDNDRVVLVTSFDKVEIDYG